MNKADLLRLAKQKIDELALERRREVEDEETEQEVVKMAIEMQRHEDVVNSLEALKINPEVLTNAMREAVATIKVESPDVVVPEIKIPPIKVPKSEVEVKIPEIKIPPIKVPKPEVTVNIPEQPAPIVNIEEKDVVFPDFMDVGLQNITPKTPLHVMPVDGAGKLLAPTAGGGGGGHVKATLQEGSNTIGNATIQASDSGSVDAFGRWRISEPTTIFDSKQLYDSQPLFWDDQEVSGAGTTTYHSTARASTTIGVTATTAGKRVRQTFMRFNYQPGKSQLFLCTGIIGSQPTDVAARMGYFDDNNGIFLENTAGIAVVGLRSSVTGSAVDTLIPQSKWNLDPMDGTGPSGIKLDWDKAQIFGADLEWLGVGRVRCFFNVDGKFYYFHEFLHANKIESVYMSTPNLPLRYEIQAGGTNPTDATMEHICSSVISEGGIQKLGVLRHVDSDEVTYGTAHTRYIAMAGRLKSTHFGVSIDIENISATVFSNDFGHWELVLGGTVTGSLTFNDVTDSAVQIALGNNTQTLAGGTSLEGAYVTASSSMSFQTPNAARLGSTIDGTAQIWYLVFTPHTNNALFGASVTWRELL